MGRLIYEGAVTMNVEDRTLAHLQSVIGAKLRRGEAFHLSWKHGAEQCTSVWVHPRCSLIYAYAGVEKEHLNLAWVDALANAANSSGGLYVVAEPAEEDAARQDPPYSDALIQPSFDDRSTP